MSFCRYGAFTSKATSVKVREQFTETVFCFCCTDVLVPPGRLQPPESQWFFLMPLISHPAHTQIDLHSKCHQHTQHRNPWQRYFFTRCRRTKPCTQTAWYAPSAEASLHTIANYLPFKASDGTSVWRNRLISQMYTHTGQQPPTNPNPSILCH